MNQIRQIQALNQKELEAGIHNPNASWHADYRDTAFINFGGLPFNLSEGDILTIFSQFGEPVFLKLARDKETGKSRGFGWIKYEDQRSTDLAVDNLGGAEIGGRLVRVDHARYKSRDDEDDTEFQVGWDDLQKRERRDRVDKSESEDEGGEESVPEVKRPRIKEEIELARLIEEHDDDDPMKEFLVEEKKKEVELALRTVEKKERKHRHHHRSHESRSHRSRRGESDGGNDKDRSDRKRSRRDDTPSADERREETPEAKDRAKDRYRDRERDRDREKDRRHRDADRDGERTRERDRRRDRDRKDDEERPREHRRHRDAEERDRDHKSRRRSRSRSPRARRDR